MTPFYTLQQQYTKDNWNILDKYILDCLLNHPTVRRLGKFDDIEFRTDKDFVTVTFRWYDITKI